MSTQQRKQKIGDYIIGKTIGKGGTGKVKLGTHEKNGNKVAIKIISKKNLNKQKKQLSKIEREIAILKLMHHPHVLGLYDVYETKTHLFLIMEYIEGGELFDYLIEKQKLSEMEALRFFQQIIFGLEYCHNRSICHRDLKPENLLLDNKHSIKIADFGMAKLIKENGLLSTSCGSPHYASPEVISGNSYNGTRADIWGCGVVLYALLTGSLPFDHKNIRKLLIKVQKGEFMIPDFVSKEGKDLISKMLVVDPNQRIYIPEIKEHEFFRKNLNPLYILPSSDIKHTKQNTKPIKLDSIDPEILAVLRTMGYDDSKLLEENLTNEKANVEKVLYYLYLKKKNQQSSKNSIEYFGFMPQNNFDNNERISNNLNFDYFDEVLTFEDQPSKKDKSNHELQNAITPTFHSWIEPPNNLQPNSEKSQSVEITQSKTTNSYDDLHEDNEYNSDVLGTPRFHRQKPHSLSDISPDSIFESPHKWRTSLSPPIIENNLQKFKFKTKKKFFDLVTDLQQNLPKLDLNWKYPDEFTLIVKKNDLKFVISIIEPNFKNFETDDLEIEKKVLISLKRGKCQNFNQFCNSIKDFIL
ncbi:serine/threonine-protein kinase gin4-related [Anaeramoeba ignava]|uniref:Serine/threonine-protein kinase gin4-related n=1 Tax=Anaeramoeba ignava TaxID=1746090 RepID=A0A9Q0LZZ6_ANAIG|nr:serine/threonine-protein kinase gin4-related [Anaeramoeba ignava]